METIRKHLEKLSSTQADDASFQQSCFGGITEAEKKTQRQYGCDVYQGKVRELIRSQDELWIYHTDRLTAFDRYIGYVPFKGVILAKISDFWLRAVAQEVPTHFRRFPHSRVIVAEAMQPFKVEVIVRGFMAGSMARAYAKGVRSFCGTTLPEGLKEFHRLPENLITPTTKAAAFEHDEEATPQELVAKGVCSNEQWQVISEMALKLYDLGQRIYDQKGWILVDTKYEFGLADDGSIKVIDEIHTPDSSRLWVKSTYEQRLAADESPEMLDKEIVRRYLLSQGFSGQGDVPPVPHSQLLQLAFVYLDVLEGLTGKSELFDPDAPLPFPAVK